MLDKSSTKKMSFPMQDTVISSTVTGLHATAFIAESKVQQCDTRESSDNNRAKAITVVAEVVSPITCHSVGEATLFSTEKSLQQSKNCCSWRLDFCKAICKLAASNDYFDLKRFLCLYAENITEDVYNNRQTKIKELQKDLNQKLLFFHFHWNSIKKHVSDDSFYYECMAIILKAYIDLELELFESKSNSVNAITEKIINMLQNYLENNEDQIFKVLVNSKLATLKHRSICFSVFKKIFLKIPTHQKLVAYKYTYYIIALKLWKSICNDQEEIEEIHSLASVILGTSIPEICYKDLGISSTSYIKQSLWYIDADSIDLPTTIVHNFCFLKNPHDEFTNDDFLFYNLIKLKLKVATCKHLKVNEDILLGRNFTSINNIKIMKKRLRPGEVVYIDLTEDNNLYQKCKKKMDLNTNIETTKSTKKSQLLSCLKSKQLYKTSNKMIEVDKKAATNPFKTESKNLESFDLNGLNSSLNKCDNYKLKDTLILSNSNGIYNDSDISEDRTHQNNEIFSNSFSDYLSNTSISSQFLNHSEGLYPSCLRSTPEFISEMPKDYVPSLFDFSLDGLDSNFSPKPIESIDPCLTHKDFLLSEIRGQDSSGFDFSEFDGKNGVPLNPEFPLDFELNYDDSINEKKLISPVKKKEVNTVSKLPHEEKCDLPEDLKSNSFKKFENFEITSSQQQEEENVNNSHKFEVQISPLKKKPGRKRKSTYFKEDSFMKILPKTDIPTIEENFKNQLEASCKRNSGNKRSPRLRNSNKS
ncbi:hypothetical protein TKK_0000682 [Trichogramma kaykai]|uniref:Uncharacterized protein n=1 Tax=Trichogramma kaykai TaxID=54128 RepID=A0ABD2VZM4_9HYME